MAQAYRTRPNPLYCLQQGVAAMNDEVGVGIDRSPCFGARIQAEHPSPEYEAYELVVIIACLQVSCDLSLDVPDLRPY